MRFVSHRRGFAKLMHNWPALITVFDEAQADRRYRGETKGKIIGITRKLHDYKFLCKVAAYLDSLEHLSPLSLVFKKIQLMPYDVIPPVNQTIDNFEEMIQEDIDDIIDSNLRKFRIVDEDDLITLVSSYPKAGHELKMAQNREYIEIELDNMTNLHHGSIEAALETRSQGAEICIPLIRERFSSFEENIFDPLCAAGFDEAKVFQEWKAVRSTVNNC